MLYNFGRTRLCMVDLLCCVPELYMMNEYVFNLHNIRFTDDALFWMESTTLYILHLLNQIFLCSIEELQRLLKDKEAYNAFFNSLDQVKTQNNVSSVARATFFYTWCWHHQGMLISFLDITLFLMLLRLWFKQLARFLRVLILIGVGYPHTTGYGK